VKSTKLTAVLAGLILCATWFALVPSETPIHRLEAATDPTEKPESQVDESNGNLGALPKVQEKAPAEYDPADPRFLMHEWGTFTSFSGADGVKLEFRPLADNDLPPFVFDRPRQAGVVPLAMVLSKNAYLSWQRMETPVIYFYAPEEMDVNVKVSFPEGLLTEFYPPVKSFLPELSETEKKLARTGSANARALGDMNQVARTLQSQLKNSELDWGTITLVPPGSLKLPLKNEVAARGIHDRMLKTLVPRTPQHFDYYDARATDSAYIHIDFPLPEIPVFIAANYKPLGAFFEKFLFYRGIGYFELSLNLRAEGNDRFTVQNSSNQPVTSLILMERTGEGKLRFVVQEVLEGNQQQELQLPAAEMKQKELEQRIETALVDAGLFRKEARAMIATWRGSWFGEPGTRMFYLLPEAHTERLLPLDIQPVPEESVRVMVGRLEIMTPDRERKLEGLLKAWANELSQPLDPKSELGVELAALGRFAEPALSRIRSSSKDPEVQRGAETMIAQLVNELERTEQAEPNRSLPDVDPIQSEPGDDDPAVTEQAPATN
jgi:hypothetical protein